MTFKIALAMVLLTGCSSFRTSRIMDYRVDYETKTDPGLQAKIEKIDATLRAKYEMMNEQSAVGVMDLRTGRLTMIHPDRGEYAASIPKIAILLAYFELHPEAREKLDPRVRHELGLMIKASSNEMAAKYSRAMGLKEIQRVVESYQFYDGRHGGGIWMGKHYGPSEERIGD